MISSYIMLIIINCLLPYVLYIDIDECLSSPCSSDMICNNTDGSYTCDCPDGTIKNGSGCDGNNGPTPNSPVAHSTSSIELSEGALAGIIVTVIIGVIIVYTGVIVVAIRFVTICSYLIDGIPSQCFLIYS